MPVDRALLRARGAVTERDAALDREALARVGRLERLVDTLVDTLVALTGTCVVLTALLVVLTMVLVWSPP